jgi:hypothetical protein
VLLFLFFVKTETEIVLGSMISIYTACAGWSKALGRLAFLQPPLLGTTTLYLAMGGVLVLASAAITETFRLGRQSLGTRQITPGPHISLPVTAIRTTATANSPRGDRMVSGDNDSVARNDSLPQRWIVSRALRSFINQRRSRGAR